MTAIQVVVKVPDRATAPKAVITSNSLRNLQALVGGLIEVINVGHGMALIVNEEGKLHGLTYNVFCPTIRDVILGTILVVSLHPDDEGEFVGLTDDEVTAAIARFTPDGEFV